MTPSSGRNLGATLGLSGFEMVTRVYRRQSAAETRKGLLDFRLNRQTLLCSLLDGLPPEDRHRVAADRPGDLPDLQAHLVLHHKLPLDGGGTNALSNLALVQRSPHHGLIHQFIREQTSGMTTGDHRAIALPVQTGIVWVAHGGPGDRHQQHLFRHQPGGGPPKETRHGR